MKTTTTTVSAHRLAAWRRLAGLEGRGHAAASAGDESAPRRERAQANRLVHGVQRHLSLLDALLERARLFDPARTPPPLLWVLRLAAFEKICQSSVPDYAIGEQAVALARRAGGAPAAGFINAMVRRLLPGLPESEAALRADPFYAALPAPVRWSIPPPVLQALEFGYGHQEIQTVAAALAEREAPVWLRVNTLKTDPARLAPDLAAEDVVAAPDPAAPPEALRWSPGAALPWSTGPWRRGELTVQDVGAMLASRLLAPAPGMSVADFCAAPGGKTGHLWELLRGRGRLVAHEVDAIRRRELRETLDRLYGPGHPIEIPDEHQAAEALPEAAFDRVLVDAPCQALGLIRRHPEIRWDGRLRLQGAMQATQSAILRAAARLVRPGGRLLWVTCSPTAAENEEIVMPFAEQSRQFWILDPTPLLPAAWRDWTQLDGGVLRTRPDIMDCDGFAMILLEKL